MADIVRCAGQAFIEHSRRWINWQHRKVLLAITRCRTAALGGHRDQTTEGGDRVWIMPFGTADKVNRLFNKRMETAQQRFRERAKKAYDDHLVPLLRTPVAPWNFYSQWVQYTTDSAQRWVLFWDTLRKRGNNFIAHEHAGKPPVLHFQYEMLLDARTFERPVNYALLKILPPEGVVVNPARRPYVIIDPRAGHGPGIGGFKDDSEAGVAMRAGHPVYFIMFFPEPVPGQTLFDVCAAEQTFVRRVRELHPDSPKPVVIGNCQGGWAAMMLAASDPETMGALVINGAPMSYWGGSWSEDEGENPMRYAGGLLGGSWVSSLVADLGDGVFDGANLVQNFENLNPANTFWDKYYQLFANIDTEPERFLDFERWWGGYSLMNKQEIEWIVQNLFVGNRVWSGDKRELGGMKFDLRDVKCPIILFASMGDNITPPQQAFNWVADTYRSTDEIKSRGQVIVGLLHKSIGHLGIFVSGKVAKKEHKQIVSVLKSIEVLPPGLYGMHILECKDADGKVHHNVQFVEHRLEEVVDRINRFKRADERPFKAVAEISEFNQRAYDLFAHPFVEHWSNQYTAAMGRLFHPMRFQRWAISDLNPWLAWLGPAADQVRGHRQPGDDALAPRQMERMCSDLVSASLDYYRDVRDAASEATFFQMYGSMIPLSDEDAIERERGEGEEELRAVEGASVLVSEGGYAEALSRAGYLLAAKGKPLPLAQFELKKKLIAKFGHLLPKLAPAEARVIRGNQEVICRYEPERALSTLPLLLSDPTDREHFLIVLDAVVEEYSATFGLTEVQSSMLQRIRELLSTEARPRATDNQLGGAHV
jgi:pimeloyl-ACP methyl ester carboxylesterase